MERFHPSQISWTGFVNRETTSTSLLWPPSDSSESLQTPPDRSTLPTTPDTAMSDWQTVTDPSECSLTSPEQMPDHVRSIESLRSFVKKEIGLNAIDNRMSQSVFKETALLSRTTMDSDRAKLEAWTREQVNRDHQSSHDVNAQQQRQYTGAGNQPIPIKPATKHERMARLKERCLNQRDSLKEAAKAIVGKLQKCFNALTGRT